MMSIADGTRRENAAEHLWSLAVMGILFVEYMPQDLDLLKVIKMVLIHYIDDTFAFDEAVIEDKEERE